MPKVSKHYLAALLFILAPVFVLAAPSGIYTWVDADGNTHFGDKPEESDQAKNVQPVELKKSYQPPSRTAEEQRAFEDEQRSMQEKGKERMNMQQQERDQARAKARDENATRCAAYATDLKKLSSSEMVNGRRQYYYVEEEDGKSVTSARQREIIQEIKDKMTALGCP